MKNILILLLLCITGCDGFTRVSGKVVEKGTGAAISGATTKLEFADDELDSAEDITDEDGKYSLLLNHAPSSSYKIVLTVQKEGYKDFSTDIAPRDSLKDYQIELVRKGKNVGGMNQQKK